jgi:hypothetical protein
MKTNYQVIVEAGRYYWRFEFSGWESIHGPFETEADAKSDAEMYLDQTLEKLKTIDDLFRRTGE